MTLTFGRALRPLWALDPDVTFLNHGSFGATPRTVLDAQAAWRARMEAQPVRFFVDDLPHLLRAAADTLARFVGTAADRLAFVENATAGVNAVLHSLRWRGGDEIVCTDHVYGAVRNTLRHVAATTGVRIVEARVGMPVADEAQMLDAVMTAITTRTRLVLIDHVASSSAVRYPVAAIAAQCRAAGVQVLVDGAHGPGMVELDVDAIGADWYVGNCHKWLCAPKGVGFLAVRPGAGDGLHPPVISHLYGEPFPAEFDWVGTRDPTAWLALPDAIAFHAERGGAALRARNRRMAIEGVRIVAGALGAPLGAEPGLFEAMATVRVPGSTLEAAAMLRRQLLDHGIEVPVMPLDGALWVRVSAFAYNEAAEYGRLARALTA